MDGEMQGEIEKMEEEIEVMEELSAACGVSLELYIQLRMLKALHDILGILESRP